MAMERTFSNERERFDAPERHAYLRARQGPWTETRSADCNCCAASDRLGLIDGRKGEHQSRALQLFQYLQLQAPDPGVLVERLEGHGPQRRGDEGVRLAAGNHAACTADEYDIRPCAARRERVLDIGTNAGRLAVRQGASRR